MKWNPLLTIHVALMFSTCSAFAQTPEEVNRAVGAYNEGVDLLSKEQYAEAASKFKEAERINPRLVEAYFNEATALMKLRQFDQALPVIDKVLALRPNSAEGHLQKAACLERLGNLNDAKTELEKYLELQPTAANAEQVRQHVALLARENSRAQVKVSANSPDYLAESIQNGTARWQKSRMPLKVFVNDGSQIPNYQSQYADLVKKSFSDWCNGSNGKVLCTFTNTPNNADIEVTWTNNPADLTTPLEGGHAQMIGTKTRLERGKIVLLTTTVDGHVIPEGALRRVALHEIGHALGLTGHSSSPSDVMYAMGGPELQGTLSKRDLNTLIALYSADDAYLAKHQVGEKLMTQAGDEDSPVLRAMKLNAEGIEALDKGDLATAKAKFEESMALRPDAAAENNIGIVLARQYSAAMKQGKQKDAAAFGQGAIAQFERARNIQGLKTILPSYCRLLDSLGDKVGAKKARARLAELKQN